VDARDGLARLFGFEGDPSLRLNCGSVQDDAKVEMTI